jgi:hypothetical protein
MAMGKMFAVMMVAASTLFVAEAMAQVQSPPPAGQRTPGMGEDSPARGEEKKVEGQVKSVDPSGTELTLTDGTTLSTPPRTVIRSGVLSEGSIVIASYREENGKKVLTGLAVKGADSPPAGAPRSPAPPPAAPPPGGSPPGSSPAPGGSTPRY